MPITSFIPAYTRANVLTGMAALFLQDMTDTPAVLPPDSQAVGTAFPVPWTAVGASEQGLQFNFQRQTNNITIEEQITPVDEETTGATIELAITLSEDTLQVMRWAFGGGTITVTAPGVGQVGKSELQLSSQMQHFSAAFEGVNQYGFWRRVLVPDVLSTGQVQSQYRNAANQRMYACTFSAVSAPEDIQIVEMTAEATG